LNPPFKKRLALIIQARTSHRQTRMETKNNQIVGKMVGSIKASPSRAIKNVEGENQVLLPTPLLEHPWGSPALHA